MILTKGLPSSIQFRVWWAQVWYSADSTVMVGTPSNVARWRSAQSAIGKRYHSVPLLETRYFPSAYIVNKVPGIPQWGTNQGSSKIAKAQDTTRSRISIAGRHRPVNRAIRLEYIAYPLFHLSHYSFSFALPNGPTPGFSFSGTILFFWSHQ